MGPGEGRAGRAGDQRCRRDAGLSPEEARSRFAAARVARLATADTGGRPHLVPIVFAVEGDLVWTAVDQKPKRTRALRRVANARANPRVSLLADHYAEDWTELWWVRADGMARVVSVDDAARGLELLAERYPVYRSQPPAGPVIEVAVARWTGWSAS